MKQLSIREKVGQLLVCGFKANTAAETSEEIIDLIKNDHVGGIILFGRNIGTPEEILQVTTTLQKAAKESGHDKPLLICIDQENGIVRRLGEGTTVFPGAMLLGATQNPEYADKVGEAVGKELKALGINWNLAPVVDVNNNPNNPVIGVRAYGEDPRLVSKFGKAAMKGMQKAGVMTALKHFPGHGDTNVDSHLALPTITHDMERLEQVELVPFKDCILEGADTVMTAHVYFPTLEKQEGVPATMSHAVITGLLREKLGFDGVVTTDCMEMKAIADTVGTAKGAVEAIKAGVDVVMISHLPSLQKEAIDAIVSAVETGEISEDRINNSFRRVNELKDKFLSWDDLNLDEGKVSEVVASPAHQQLADDVFRAGITIVKGQGSALPLSNKADHKVLVVFPTNSHLTMVEDERYSSNALGEAIREVHPTATIQQLSPNPTAEEIDQAVSLAVNHDTVIIGALSSKQSKEQQELGEKLAKSGKKIVVIGMRTPYDLTVYPKADATVVTYEFTTPALKMTAKALYGIEQVTGTLPVTLQ